MKPFVIGLVGEASSGKGQIAQFLQDKGFSYFSLSDSLRKVATLLELTHERETLITIGNTLRDSFGADILARGAQNWFNNTGNTRVVIDSIRNPGEVKFLQQEMDVLIVGVTMSPEKRFQLMVERQRPGDPQTWPEFQDLLSREQGVGEKASGIQVAECLRLADCQVQNEGTIVELHRQMDEILSSKGFYLEGFRSSPEKR